MIDPTMASEPGPQHTTVDRKIAQARVALGFERVWAALHWPLVILAAGAALVVAGLDRKSTRLNSSHVKRSRMPSSA